MLINQFSTKHSAPFLDGQASEAAEPARCANPTLRKVVEEPFHPAAPAPSHLIGSIVKKGFSTLVP
jgi:hypothetical protein